MGEGYPGIPHGNWDRSLFFRQMLAIEFLFWQNGQKYFLDGIHWNFRWLEDISIFIGLRKSIRKTSFKSWEKAISSFMYVQWWHVPWMSGVSGSTGISSKVFISGGISFIASDALKILVLESEVKRAGGDINPIKWAEVISVATRGPLRIWGGVDSWGEELSLVPFVYYFSASYHLPKRDFEGTSKRF